MEPRVLELFAGIGGAARAFQNIGQIVAAVDINQNAKQVYQQNFSHPYLTRSIEDLTVDEIREFDANTWWVSAPCQPYTRRGKQKDDLDPRSKSLQHLTSILHEIKPTCFLLENVIGFRGSRCHQGLIDSLDAAGYRMAELDLCPSEMGIPNRRPRYYLLAALDPGVDPERVSSVVESGDFKQLKFFIDDSVPDDFVLPDELLSGYADGMNVVNADARISNCFTSAYARSLAKSGSFLRMSDGRVRRFTPLEISRLLGFQDSTEGEPFLLPESLTARQMWKLLGNSISVYMVRQVLEQLFPVPKSRSPSNQANSISSND